MVAPKLTIVPPPEPTVQEFVSPLRSELQALLDAKHGIGYTDSCRLCRAHRAQDAQIATAVAAKQDAVPYVVAMRDELIAIRKSNADLKAKLSEMQRWNTPASRIRLGIYYSAGAITFTAILTVLKLLFFGTP